MPAGGAVAGETVFDPGYTSQRVHSGKGRVAETVGNVTQSIYATDMSVALVEYGAAVHSWRVNGVELIRGHTLTSRQQKSNEEKYFSIRFPTGMGFFSYLRVVV